MPQTVSLKTAKRLRDLGKTWPLEAGTHYSWPSFEYAKVFSGMSAGGYPLDTVPDEYLVLPRLDQVMVEIERLVPPHCTIEFGLLGGGDHYCVVKDVSLLLADRGSGFGPNDTEAAGQVLAQIMERQKQ